MKEFIKEFLALQLSILFPFFLFSVLFFLPFRYPFLAIVGNVNNNFTVY